MLLLTFGMLLGLHTSPSSFEYIKLTLLIVAFDRTFPKLAKATAGKAKCSSNPSFVTIPVVVGDAPFAGPPSPSTVVPPAINMDSTILEIARAIAVSTDVYVDAATTTLIRGLTYQSTRHMNATSKLIDRFFRILSCSPLLGLMAADVLDPESVNPTKRFYLLLRGDPSPSKKDTLNGALVFFAQALRKLDTTEVKPGTHSIQEVANTMYQPNTLEKIHKQLFAEFRRNGILLQQKDYNSYGAGSYKAYWKSLFAETVEHREDFGRLPNRSSYDPNEELKLRTRACPEWDFTNFRDLMWLFTFRIMTDYMLRGSQEVRLYPYCVLCSTDGY
jgi:hypothetical protein